MVAADRAYPAGAERLRPVVPRQRGKPGGVVNDPLDHWIDFPGAAGLAYRAWKAFAAVRFAACTAGSIGTPLTSNRGAWLRERRGGVRAGWCCTPWTTTGRNPSSVAAMTILRGRTQAQTPSSPRQP